VSEPGPARPPERIWLIGLMGSGKSTVGPLVAAAVGTEYLDNDATIASLSGRTTVALAAAGGELLHQWESRYVHRVVDFPPPVVAGIPASIADRGADLDLLAGRGLLVYLRVDLDTLVARVTAGPPRPWLTGDPRQVLAGMISAREPVLAAAAGLVVDATRPPAEVAARIVAARPALGGTAEPGAAP
jgi:shikimate kinase